MPEPRPIDSVLKDLLATNPRYRQMVNAFQGLAGLESDLTFLTDLKAEAEQGLATELREAEERAAELRQARRKAIEASHTRPEPQQGGAPGAVRAYARQEAFLADLNHSAGPPREPPGLMPDPARLPSGLGNMRTGHGMDHA